MKTRKNKKTRRHKAKLNKSGLPRGSLVGYIMGTSCGRGHHKFVLAKTGKYAVCVKCHLRLVLKHEKEEDQDAVDNSL
jgi:hypothetical protein